MRPRIGRISEPACGGQATPRERVLKPRAHVLAAAALAMLLLTPAAPALAQHEQPAAPAVQAGGQTAAVEHAAEGQHGAEGDHGNPIVATVARLLNFAVLAGVLIYFLRSPIKSYLGDRGRQIRADLVKAAEMRTSAAAQAAAIEQKMAALPGELDALRKTGAEEAAAEEARIRAIADAERTRLQEQARREIHAQLKLAERDLTARTADLAVAVAAKRVKATINAADQARLVEQYLGRLGAAQTADRQVTA
jgi:F-type H+-transporting ATPase subunit b